MAKPPVPILPLPDEAPGWFRKLWWNILLDWQYVNFLGTAGSASPLTTKGDIWGYSTTNARIPVGPDGDVLTADSTQTLGVKWGAGGGSGTVTHTAGALTAGQLVIGNGGADITVGDLSGDATTSGSTAVTVGKINGVAVSGTPSVGQVIVATGSSAASWQTRILSGTVVSATALGSEPGSPNTGDVNLPTNGFGAERYNGTTWANSWGPLFPLTFPPLVNPGITTTLSAAITTTGATTFTATATGFPATPFLIIIDTEEMKVTNITGTTWTVVRGYNSTTAATHLISATVTLENWDWINKFVLDTVTQETNQGFNMFLTPSTLNRRAYKRLIGTSGLGSTTVTLGVFPSMTTPTANFASVGLFLRESATGKCYQFALVLITAGNQYYVQYYDTTAHFSTSNSTGQTLAVGSLLTMSPTILWLRLNLSGSTMVASFSNDGQNFTQVNSLAKTVPFTTAPDEWGITVTPDTSDTYGANVNVVSWNES